MPRKNSKIAGTMGVGTLQIVGTRGEIRTHNLWFLKPLPLPIGLHGHIL